VTSDADEAPAARPSIIARLVALSDVDRERAVMDLSPDERRTLLETWHYWAHKGQIAPPGDWRVWLIRAGRGFGKTRAGAEWVSNFARGHPGARIALVGHTVAEVIGVMIKGTAGLQACARHDEPIRWEATSLRVTFASGASATVFSAEAPERLRGFEHDAAWCDELAKWRHGQPTWDNLMMGLRCGERPRVVVTTTPRPTPLLRKVMAMDGFKETRGATRDNPHLPPVVVRELDAQYGGTRLGRQELDGELIDDLDQALWTRARIEACRATAMPAVRRVVIGVDPPSGGGTCGIVAVALASDGLAYVLEDASVSAVSPDRWADAVAACAARHAAARVVAERNQGGEMVRSVLRAADEALPVAMVQAAQSKVARAEPVSALYERDRVRHLGRFPALEDELCGLVLGGAYQGPGGSPDRADALVWALHALMLGRAQGAVGVRTV
jgi:phage terminase large subunit-like protein